MHPFVSPPLGDARCRDSLIKRADALAASIRHGPVALDLADDMSVIVADLQAARARIVDGPGLLPVLICRRPWLNRDIRAVLLVPPFGLRAA